ncbi:MAG: flagellar M-ring protein FliF [Pyrinomonadaceae bacterium]|nr:flagellar M-ring protein FliF [Pyrinomonadaceae bacterium]
MSAINQITDIWNKMPMRGRVMTAVAAIATLGLVGTIAYWGTQDEYGVLFSDLKPENASVIIEKLDAEGVPHATTNGGTTVEIPRNRISEMRLKMAGSGVLSGGHVGFDLFDKTNFGATDFAQQINFRRAVEGELARTLEGMDEVETARVHVTPQKESVFTQQAQGAKASVMLRVRQGNQLSADRTDAIVALVSSSVEGLEPSSVSVLDTRGRLLTAAVTAKSGKSDAGNFADQLESKRKFETETAARVVALLTPIAGDGGVMADVSADVDFSQVETTEEKFDPQSQVVRSQRTATEKSNQESISPSNNIAGARANDPAVPAPQTSQENKKTGNDERNATTTNYEIDRTITKTVGGGGRVNRINVSVVVDHKQVEGNRVARTANELSQIERLVSAAVGADTERGDSVVVQTMPFDQGDISSEQAAAATFLDSNKEIVSTSIKYGVLGIVTALLLFFVFRPAKKALKAAIAAPSGPDQLEDGRGALAGDRRLNAAPDSATLQDGSPMTVAELESKMSSASDSSGITNSGSESARQLEAMKDILTSGGNSSSEVVVGTLRGWLRE